MARLIVWGMCFVTVHEPYGHKNPLRYSQINSDRVMGWMKSLPILYQHYLAPHIIPTFYKW